MFFTDSLEAPSLHSVSTILESLFYLLVFLFLPLVLCPPCAQFSDQTSETHGSFCLIQFYVTQGHSFLAYSRRKYLTWGPDSSLAVHGIPSPRHPGTCSAGPWRMHSYLEIQLKWRLVLLAHRGLCGQDGLRKSLMAGSQSDMSRPSKRSIYLRS